MPISTSKKILQTYGLEDKFKKYKKGLSSKYKDISNERTIDMISVCFYLNLAIAYAKDYCLNYILKDQKEYINNEDKEILSKLSDKISKESRLKLRKDLFLRLKKINKGAAFRNLEINNLGYDDCADEEIIINDKDLDEFGDLKSGIEINKRTEQKVENDPITIKNFYFNNYDDLYKDTEIKLINYIIKKEKIDIKNVELYLYNKILQTVNKNANLLGKNGVDGIKRTIIIEYITDIEKAIGDSIVLGKYNFKMISLKNLRKEYSKNYKFNSICAYCGKPIFSSKNSINTFCLKNDNRYCYKKRNKK